MASTTCGETTLAYQGMPGPEGGILRAGAYITPAATAKPGQIAFYARVQGLPRNEGVFVADANGVRAIAIGSGLGLGSGVPGPPVGDPTPIGGRFAGFPNQATQPPFPWPDGPTLWLGDAWVPGTNAQGDVVFLADVRHGRTPRALFLYRAARDTIEKVAAIGDPSPGGGHLSAIGMGSINNHGVVVFEGFGDSQADEQILRWEDGILSLVARIGDPAPTHGETYGAFLGHAGYGLPDGTYLPTEGTPDINDAGTIVFNVGYTLPTGYHGIVRVDGATSSWYGQWGDPAPGGGVLQRIWDASLNENGDVAFGAFYLDDFGNKNYAWFAGGPGHWRKAIELGELLAGAEQVHVLAASHNPMSPFNARGDLIVWTDTYAELGEQEFLLMCSADGIRTILAQEGEPTPLGGTSKWLAPWPSIHPTGQVPLGTGILGASNGADAAYFLLDLCPRSGVDGESWTSSGTPVNSATSAASCARMRIPGVNGPATVRTRFPY